MQVLDLYFLAKKAAQSHVGLPVVLRICSKCRYYHYLCDGVDDRGWGCGYRSLQSLCSWAENMLMSSPITPASDKHPLPNAEGDDGIMTANVPSLRRIQEALFEVGDKPQSFVGSREWIGSYEACIILDHLYCVPSKIIHVGTGIEVGGQVKLLSDHFKTVGSPVMIGGDVDGASKTLIGIATDPTQLDRTSFLIADPHYNGPPDTSRILGENHVAWHGLDLFQDVSFYNFCMPQLPSSVP